MLRGDLSAFENGGGIPTAITQNLKDLLASAEIENIFEKQRLYPDAQCRRRATADSGRKSLGISARQLSYVKQSGAGEGCCSTATRSCLLWIVFHETPELYRLMTTA